MYHVPPTSRPRLGLLLIDCLWYGARRGAFYGLCGGAAYGAFWLIIGAVIGGPIGFVLGSVVGALHGLICAWPDLRRDYPSLERHLRQRVQRGSHFLVRVDAQTRHGRPFLCCL
jgi:hypothetical protein